MGVANGLKSPVNSHIIDSIILINYESKKYDLTQVLQKMVIYEDMLERGYHHGTLTIQDDNALHLNLPIIGQEWLEVSFRTRLDGGVIGKDIFKKKYKITSIRDIAKQKENENQLLVMDFVSEGYWISECNLFSKSYRGYVTSDLVLDIFQNSFGMEIEVEPTLYPRDWIIPNIPAFDFIYRLTNESTSKENLSTDYRFYESIDGWNFKSLYTLAQADFTQRLNILPKNLNEFDRLNCEGQKKDVHFDIEDQKAGGLRITMDELDTIQKRVNRFQLRYEDYRTSYTGMNPESIYLGELDYPDDMCYWLQTGNQAYQANRDSSINQRLKRRMNRSLMDSSTTTVRLPGNLDLKLGSTVWFDFKYEGVVDQTTSGKYLICKIKHEVAQNEYYMTLDIRKDSNIKGEKIES